MAVDPKAVKQVVRETLKEKVIEAGRDSLRKLAGGSDVHLPELTVEPIYRSSIPPAAEQAARTLVILCSSARFGPQSREFLAEFLKIADYDLVAIPGGVQWLALPDILPKHYKVGRGVAEYLIRKHRLDRVICIAHEDCSAYSDSQTLSSLAHLLTGKSVEQHQLDQLRKVGHDLVSAFGVNVELYYASNGDGTVVFRKVDLS